MNYLVNNINVSGAEYNDGPFTVSLYAEIGRALVSSLIVSIIVDRDRKSYEVLLNLYCQPFQRSIYMIENKLHQTLIGPCR